MQFGLGFLLGMVCMALVIRFGAEVLEDLGGEWPFEDLP
jgi:hypothetical protein